MGNLFHFCFHVAPQTLFRTGRKKFNDNFFVLSGYHAQDGQSFNVQKGQSVRDSIIPRKSPPPPRLGNYL